MNTEYLHTITARCPLSLVDDANHLVCVLGTSMTDLNAYGTENYVGYSVISFAAKIDTLQTVQSGTLTRPEHDVNNEIDMVKAQNAKDHLIIVTPVEEGELTPYGDDDLVAFVGFDTQRAISMMNLTPVVDQ